MTITLWGRTNSSNVMKVLWLLDELGLTFERIDAGLAFGRNDTAAFRALSPFGLIPVLQDGDVTLFESNTILRYLVRTHAPDSPLYPRETAARSRCESWMDAQLASFAALGTVFLQLVRTPPERRSPAVVAEATDRSAAAFSVLDDVLATRIWLAGADMTLADIAFGPIVHRWMALPIARPPLAGLEAYYQRLLVRPHYVVRCAGALS